MTRDSAKIREFAEAYFGKTQDRLRSRVSEERDTVTRNREENTLRLRALRLAQEAATPPAPARKRAKAKSA